MRSQALDHLAELRAGPCGGDQVALGDADVNGLHEREMEIVGRRDPGQHGESLLDHRVRAGDVLGSPRNGGERRQRL